MNKKIYALFAFLVCAVIVFSSCAEDDDDTALMEWKAYNEKLFSDVVKSGEYRARASYSGNGDIYWKTSNTIKSQETRITPEGTPHMTDTVVCRYTGWYYTLDGTKYEFDSTEGDANGQAGRQFLMTGFDKDQRFLGVADGWTTMLLAMAVNDEVEFCIPYNLAYGSAGNSPKIPGYTTLWFTMKLLEIKPSNPNEYPK